MKYEHGVSKKGRKFFAATIYTETDDTRNENILIGYSLQGLKNLIKSTYNTAIKKQNRVSWNTGKAEIVVLPTREYSDYEKLTSRHIVKCLRTISSTRTIEHRITKIRNVHYEGNPVCDLCYKKTVETYPTLILDNKTTKDLCQQCKKQITHVRNHLKTISMVKA